MDEVSRQLIWLMITYFSKLVGTLHFMYLFMNQVNEERVVEKEPTFVWKVNFSFKVITIVLEKRYQKTTDSDTPSNYMGLHYSRVLSFPVLLPTRVHLQNYSTILSFSYFYLSFNFYNRSLSSFASQHPQSELFLSFRSTPTTYPSFTFQFLISRGSFLTLTLAFTDLQHQPFTPQF